jgi:hypothetical protein
MHGWNWRKIEITIHRCGTKFPEGVTSWNMMSNKKWCIQHLFVVEHSEIRKVTRYYFFKY